MPRILAVLLVALSLVAGNAAAPAAAHAHPAELAHEHGHHAADRGGKDIDSRLPADFSGHAEPHHHCASNVPPQVAAGSDRIAATVRLLPDAASRLETRAHPPALEPPSA